MPNEDGLLVVHVPTGLEALPLNSTQEDSQLATALRRCGGGVRPIPTRILCRDVDSARAQTKPLIASFAACKLVPSYHRSSHRQSRSIATW